MNNDTRKATGESKNIAYGRPTRTEACSDAEIQKDFSAIYNR